MLRKLPADLSKLTNVFDVSGTYSSRRFFNVLILDDSLFQQKVILELFCNLRLDTNVFLCDSLKDAYSKCLESKCDLIFIDELMLNQCSINFFQSIRNLYFEKKFKAVIVSICSDTSLKQTCCFNATDAFVLKPIASQDIIQIIKTWFPKYLISNNQLKKEEEIYVGTRKEGESITIGKDAAIKVTALRIKGKQIRLGITASKDIQFLQELMK